MRIFKKKERKEKKDDMLGTPIKGEHLIVAYVFSGILRLQQQWAERMNRITAGFSNRQQKIWLIIFCLAGLFCTLWPLYQVIKKRGSLSLELGKINRPTLLPEMRKAKPFSAAGLEKIKHFHGHLDSLDELQRESLLNEREGLLDSIERMEQWYKMEVRERR